MIISKLKVKIHAHFFQTMAKTPVKYQKNRRVTVGGIAHTSYPLLLGVRKDRSRKGRMYGRTEYEILFSKWQGNKNENLKKVTINFVPV